MKLITKDYEVKGSSEEISEFVKFVSRKSESKKKVIRKKRGSYLVNGRKVKKKSKSSCKGWTDTERKIVRDSLKAKLTISAIKKRLKTYGSIRTNAAIYNQIYRMESRLLF